MFELKNHKSAIPVVLIAGLFWSFGPYVVRHIDQAETVPWQYLFTRGIVIFILLNVIHSQVLMNYLLSNEIKLCKIKIGIKKPRCLN